MRWALAICLAGATGCEGILIGIDPPDSGPIGIDAPGVDAGPRPDAGPGVDAGVPPYDAGPPFDAGPCTGAELGGAFSITPISGAGSPSLNLHAAPTPSGGAVIAYASGGVHVVRVDGAGVIASDDMVAGNEVWGVATSGGSHAVMVDRGSDELLLVGLGATTFETRIMGAVPHDVAENEWFGPLLRAGRVDWTGSQWVAYATVQRLWGSDGIAHYGDTLRLLSANGSPASTVWDWGCSHSIEVALTHNATGIGPACISDCFPDKGVFFHHRTHVFADPSGDCMGGIATRMGGIAADANGFAIAFASPEGRSSLDVAVARVGNDRSVGAITWLTADGANDGDVRIAPFAGGFLVGWRGASGDLIVRTDSNGNAIGAPAPISAPLAGSSDFFAHASGDVGWVARTGSGLGLARVRACF